MSKLYILSYSDYDEVLNMEYIASVQIQTPTFVSCKNCKLWFSVEYGHCCSWNIDTIIYDHDINWNMT